MSTTSFITLSLLIKLWILGITFYVIRATSSEFDVALRKELFCYVGITLVVFASEPLFGFSFIGGKALEMNRQESDLVKDYLRNRQGQETLGDYLLRLEMMEEEEELLRHDPQRSKGQQRRSRRPPPTKRRKS